MLNGHLNKCKKWKGRHGDLIFRQDATLQLQKELGRVTGASWARRGDATVPWEILPPSAGRWRPSQQSGAGTFPFSMSRAIQNRSQQRSLLMTTSSTLQSSSASEKTHRLVNHVPGNYCNQAEAPVQLTFGRAFPPAPAPSRSATHLHSHSLWALRFDCIAAEMQAGECAVPTFPVGSERIYYCQGHWQPL